MSFTVYWCLCESPFKRVCVFLVKVCLFVGVLEIDQSTQTHTHTYTLQILKNPTNRMGATHCAAVWPRRLKPCWQFSSSENVVKSHYQPLVFNLHFSPMFYNLIIFNLIIILTSISLHECLVGRRKEWCYLTVTRCLQRSWTCWQAGSSVWSLHVFRVSSHVKFRESSTKATLMGKLSSCQAALNLSWPNSKTAAIVYF